MNTNDFSFYENEKKIEMNQFDKKILTEYINKEKKYLDINHYIIKKFHLKDFEQLKFEIKNIENNIENYFNIPFMKNNIQCKKVNKSFGNEEDDLKNKNSKNKKK